MVYLPTAAHRTRYTFADEKRLRCINALLSAVANRALPPVRTLWTAVPHRDSTAYCAHARLQQPAMQCNAMQWNAMPTALEVNCAQSNGARLTNRPLLYFAVLATAQPIDV